MDTLRHPAQVWPGFDKKLNFLPSANKAKAAQVQLLFVCDFWQWSSFRNRAGEAKTQWKQCTESFTSSADQRDSWGLLLQTKKLLRKLEANICKSHYFQFKIVFPVFLCFHPKERETWGGSGLLTKGRRALFIKRHVCYQSFVMPFGAGQKRQNNLTSVLTDRCNFNLTWKAEHDMKGGEKSDPSDEWDGRWQWKCHPFKGEPITQL